MAAKAVVKVPEASSRSKIVIKVIKVVVNIFLSFSFLDNLSFIRINWLQLYYFFSFTYFPLSILLPLGSG